MPELPEVEVVKRSLSSKIQKLVVKKITVKDEKLRYRINKKKLDWTQKSATKKLLKF